MGQILIRNIDDAVHQRLKSMAAEKGVSLEAYVRGLLQEVVGPDIEDVLAEADAIRAMSKPVSRPSEEIIREMREERDAQLLSVIGLRDYS